MVFCVFTKILHSWYCLYRSANSDAVKVSVKEVIAFVIRDNAGLHSSNLLIVGDFNFPNVNWHSWSTPPSGTIGGLFLNALDDEFLIQRVSLQPDFERGKLPQP